MAATSTTSGEDLLALLRLSEAVNATLDISQICAQACRIAQEQLHVDHSGFVLFDEDLREGTVIAEFPDLGATKGTRIRVQGVPDEEKLLSTRVPMVIPDLKAAEGLAEIGDFLLSLGIASMLLIPVVGRGRVLGSLSLDRFSVGEFTNHQSDLCSAFAAHIALAIDNANLYQSSLQSLSEEQESQRRIKLLLELSEMAGGTGGLSEVYPAMAETIRIATGALSTRILIADSDRRFLVERGWASAETFVSANARARWADLQRWQSVGRFLRAGELTRSESTEQSAPPWVGEWKAFAGYPDEGDILTLVPLGTGDSVWGLLEISHCESRKDASPAHISRIQEMATQIAALVDRVRLRESAERRAELHDRLEHYHRQLLEEKDDGLLRVRALDFALELVGWDAGAVYRYSFLENRLSNVVVRGLDDPAPGLLSLDYGAGLVGRAAASRKAILSTDYSRSDDQDVVVPAQIGDVALAVPIMPYSDLDSVLFLCAGRTDRVFLEMECEILVRFAARIASVLGTLPIRHPDLMLRDLNALQVLTEGIRSEQNIEVIAFKFLTVVTASFGLRFNRAVLLLRDEDGLELRGVMGIGQFSKDDARQQWDSDETAGRTTIAWFQEVTAATMTSSLTPVGHWARTLSVPIRGSEAGVLAEVEQTGRPMLVADRERLPEVWRQRISDTEPVAVVPMMARLDVIGILIVDNAFSRSRVSERDLRSLTMFANAAAVAIDNVRLFQEQRERQERLRGVFVESTRLAEVVPVEADLQTVLKGILGAALVAAEAKAVSLLLFGGGGEVLERIGWDPGDEGHRTAMATWSGKVRSAGEPTNLRAGSDSWPLSGSSLFGSVIILPWMLGGHCQGTIWLWYRVRKAPAEMNALVLFAQQASTVYESALRVRHLTGLHDATRAMASAPDHAGAATAIVQETLRLFEASVATLWPFDHLRDRFIPESVAVAGIDSDVLREPRAGGTSRRILEEGYCTLSGSQSEFLRRKGLSCAQGLCIKAGGDTVAVLYVAFRNHRTFVADDERRLRAFAAFAGLALQRARYLEQTRTVQQAVKVVAEQTAQADLRVTLQGVANHSRRALGCDIVTLFVYDQDTETLGFPPTVAGELLFPERMISQDRQDAEALVRGVLAQAEDVLVAESPDEQLDFGWLFHNRFSQDEAINSCLAVPLRASSVNVGVMFVDYRLPHRFATEDVENAKLFAHQAAVAIINGQLFAEKENRIAYQKAAIQFAERMLTMFESEVLLEETVLVARDHLGSDRANLVLRQLDSRLKVVAQVGWPENELQEYIEDESHAGHAIRSRSTVPVDDFGASQPFDVPERIRRAGLTSGLAVPIFRDGEAIGALLVHTKRRRKFTPAEALFLSEIANSAIIAHDRSCAQDLYRVAMKKIEHELPQYMPSIRNFAETLLSDEEHPLSDKQRRWVRYILEQAWETDRVLINVPQAVSRPNAPIDPDQLKVESIARLIESAVTRVRQTADLIKHVDVTLELPSGDSLEAEVADVLIERVIHNLVSNALSLTPDYGKVTITAFRTGDTITVSVTDTGPGIPAEEQALIFTAFYQSPFHQRLRRGGMGLGLKVAADFVEQHRGKIWVTSEVDKGAQFSFSVPVRQTPEIEA
jgi:GAF domain-containing protein/nitrogen-specific signal transduction histidine kinase